MRTDIRYKLTLASIFALIPLVLATIVICAVALSGAVAFFPLYILAGAFVVTLILSFVPFMKDHMWLSVIAVILVSALTGFIINMVII